MQKLDRKQYFAADLADQLRALPSDAKSRIMDQGYFVCELNWRDEKSLDAGLLDLTIAINTVAQLCEHRAKVKAPNFLKTQRLEKVLADLIEKAWLYCIIHSRSSRTGSYPNLIAVHFASHRAS